MEKVTAYGWRNGWRNAAANWVLFLFGIALWQKGVTSYVSYLLPLAWILNFDSQRLNYVIKEPLSIGILIFCGTLALGILWSDYPRIGLKVWKRYIPFLFFLPYLSLLTESRLTWAISGLAIGYCGILIAGLYQWIFLGLQGIPPLEFSYTSFSLVLGVGVIFLAYLTSVTEEKKLKLYFWFLAVFLLFIQFNQNGRIALLATIITVTIFICIRYKEEAKKLIGVSLLLLTIIGVFALSSSSLQKRLDQAESDIELIKQAKYNTSLGYRLAMWDVGLNGMVERPIYGYGTGMAAPYFDKTVETYKSGLYKDLPQFLKTYHYHNDWIEIGMHIGMLGILAYALLLWNWFRTLRDHQLTILGVVFVCFIFLAGLAETLVFFRQTLYLLLAITAICISCKSTNR
ncbi:MAG TPA: O-antigen ligase family protein [Nitrosospira sp.]|nr:O-antigen ligase family protein [Nitrosospira sp.]